MGPGIALIVAAALLVLVVVGYGLFGPRKSVGIALIALVAASFSAAGALHAWGETRSIPWTIGYGLVIFASITAGVRQFVGRTTAS